MGQESPQELIVHHSLLAPTTKVWGRYNGATTVARAEWLTERGHPDKIRISTLFDLLRMRLGFLNPSQFPISEYLEIYRRPLEAWLAVFGEEYPTNLSWWVTPYSFDIQCETGKILINDYSGDFTEWCIRHLREQLEEPTGVP